MTGPSLVGLFFLCFEMKNEPCNDVQAVITWLLLNQPCNDGTAIISWLLINKPCNELLRATQLYCMTAYNVVRCRTRSLAISRCYHCIPGKILSHFDVRQSSESPIQTIQNSFPANLFTKCQNGKIIWYQSEAHIIWLPESF